MCTWSCACGGQRATLRSWLCPSTTWVLDLISSRHPWQNVSADQFAGLC